MADEVSLEQFSFDQVKDRNKFDKCWLVIHDHVYDVSKFLDEHPGGEEVLLEQAGGDATESFEDVGHSTDARELMKDYLIGVLREEDRRDNLPTKVPNYDKEDKDKDSGSWLGNILIPAAIIVAIAVVAYKLAM